MPCNEPAVCLTLQLVQIASGIVGVYLSVDQRSARVQLMFAIFDRNQLIHRPVCLPRGISQNQRVRTCTSQQLAGCLLDERRAEDLCPSPFRQDTQFEATKDFV
jgi:hypothetical protein